MSRWYKVKARNWAGVETDYSAAVQGWTQAIMPAPADPWLEGIYLSSAVVKWVANGNNAGTLYQAAVSTSNVFESEISTYTGWGTDVFLSTFTALTSNKRYYFGVRAKGDFEGAQASNWAVLGTHGH